MDAMDHDSGRQALGQFCQEPQVLDLYLPEVVRWRGRQVHERDGRLGAAVPDHAVAVGHELRRNLGHVQGAADGGLDGAFWPDHLVGFVEGDLRHHGLDAFLLQDRLEGFSQNVFLA